MGGDAVGASRPTQKVNRAVECFELILVSRRLLCLAASILPRIGIVDYGFRGIGPHVAANFGRGLRAILFLGGVCAILAGCVRICLSCLTFYVGQSGCRAKFCVFGVTPIDTVFGAFQNFLS